MLPNYKLLYGMLLFSNLQFCNININCRFVTEKMRHDHSFYIWQTGIWVGVHQPKSGAFPFKSEFSEWRQYNHYFSPEMG